MAEDRETRRLWLAERVGARIEQARAKKGLTQWALAQELETQQRLIYEYESGSRVPSLDQLYRLARVLQVEVTQLLPDDAAEAYAEFAAEGGTAATGS